MKNKTNLSIIFLSILCIFTISNAETGYGISDVGTISSITGIEDENTTLVEHELGQNYPHPFNPVTKMNFSLSKSSFVTLEVYNSLGQKVTTLINNKLNSGSYKVKFNGSKLSSGIYYYKIQAGEFHSVMKMLLLQ